MTQVHAVERWVCRALVVAAMAGCQSPSTTEPKDRAQKNQDIIEALAQLPEARVLQYHADGVPQFIVGVLGRVDGAREAGLATGDASLRAAMEPLLQAFRLESKDLALRKVNVDEVGGRHYRYYQKLDDMDVVGGDLVIHVDVTGTITGANGTARGDIPASLAAASITESAANLAIAGDARWAGISGRQVTASRAVYIQTLDGSMHKALEQTVEGLRGQDPIRDKVYVDALSGAVLEVHPTIHFAKNRITYSANNGTSLPGTQKRTEGQAATGDTAVDAAHDGAGDFYDAYKLFFNRDSYNNAGVTLRSSAHYSTNYCNAYWSSTQMVYGDGDGSGTCTNLTAIDVVGHELTHAVIENESNLTYSGESGGLNESLSDIFGSFIESYVDGGRNGTTMPFTTKEWLIGDLTIPPFLRNLCDPAADGSSADVWASSIGGVDVHYSSGPNNLVYCLLVKGGTHPRGKTTIAVPAIGLDKAIRIFYYSNVNRLTASSNYAAMRTAMENSVTDLGYDQATKDAVGCAYAAIKVGTTPAACGGTGSEPQISAPSSLAFGNVEVGKTSSTRGLTVTNIGQSNLTISNASLISGTDYAVLSGTTGAQTTVVPPMGSVTWTLVCTPTVQGPRPGTFRILSNSFTQSTADVSLSCTGQRGNLTVSTSSISFGTVTQGATAPAQTVTLSNTGNLAVNNITATFNPAAVGYSIDPAGNPVPTSLAAGASVVISVRFAPQAVTDGGAATLTFAGNWGTTPTPTTATVSITGTVLTAGYTLSAATLDFGDLRFDTTADLKFCIANPNQATVQIGSPIAIAPGPGTVTGEFTVLNIRRQTTCGGTSTTNVTLPQSLTTGQLLEVTVRADPANRTGLMQATLTVNSDLPMNPTRTLVLAGNSTTGVFSLSPGPMVDFGAVDVQATAVTRTITITITNTGDASLDLANFQRTANASFTLALPGATTLAPNQALSLVVTYKPTVARPAGSEENITLSHSVAGAIASPSAGTIVIRGRGIDRALDLAATPTFPDTFKNPGDQAPVRALRIQNLGEAPLKLTAVMITATPDVWQLVDASPVELASGASHEILVRFSPKLAGPAPAAKLQVVHDDDMKPMVSVDLIGRGLDRSVMFAPDVIDIGYVAAGGVLTLADAISVTNLDGTHTFRFQRIEVGRPELEILNADDIDIAPGSTRSFSVRFSPEEEGDFETSATLFLDQDPDPQATVTLRGHAYSVNVHGGGGAGCGAGRGGGGAMALIILAAVAGRRRRSGQGPAASRPVGPAAIAVLAVLAAHTSVAADDIQVGVFDPVPSTATGGFQLESADIGTRGDWVVTSVLSLATNPMVIEPSIQGSVVDEVRPISQRAMLELGGAYAFLGRFEAGLRMPFYLQRGDAAAGETMLELSSARGAALGDLTLHGKARLVRAAWLTAGAALHVTLPTSTQDRFTGIDLPSARVLGLVTLKPSPSLTLSINGGPVLRKSSAYRKEILIEQGSGLAWGVGASLHLTGRLYVTGEVFGELVRTSEQMSSSQSPIEELAGASYRLERRITLGAAIGRGISKGLGAPELRGTLTLAFTPGAAEPTPARPRPSPRTATASSTARTAAHGRPRTETGTATATGVPTPTPIATGSSTCATSDRGRRRTGTATRTATAAPELDNDGDGLLDAQDRCPLQPETIDGYQDGDGCPDQRGEAVARVEVDPEQSPAKAAEATFQLGRTLLKEKKYQPLRRHRVQLHLSRLRGRRGPPHRHRAGRASETRRKAWLLRNRSRF